MRNAPRLLLTLALSAALCPPAGAVLTMGTLSGDGSQGGAAARQAPAGTQDKKPDPPKAAAKKKPAVKKTVKRAGKKLFRKKKKTAVRPVSSYKFSAVDGNSVYKLDRNANPIMPSSSHKRKKTVKKRKHPAHKKAAGKTKWRKTTAGKTAVRASGYKFSDVDGSSVYKLDRNANPIVHKARKAKKGRYAKKAGTKKSGTPGSAAALQPRKPLNYTEPPAGQDGNGGQ